MSPGTRPDEPFHVAARPVPARSVVQLDPAVFAADVPAGTRVSVAGDPVQFRTAAAAAVPPVRITRIERNPPSDDVGERLRLTLTADRPLREVPFHLPPRIDTDGPAAALRLFVTTRANYRALTRSPVRAWVACDGAAAQAISEDAIRPAMFDVADALLPADPREPDAVRLLAEWAVCPEKFQFVDVVGLRPEVFPAGVTEAHIDLALDAESAAHLGEGTPSLLAGCVPVVDRSTVELPPVPLRGAAEVRLDVDPLTDAAAGRAVVDVLRARTVRAGRTVTTYAGRPAPLPTALAGRPARVGTWSLRRQGEAAHLVLHPPPASTGATLLVTAACCRRAPTDTPVGFAPGVRAVGPVRPPVWPTGLYAAAAAAADLSRSPTPLVHAVAGAFGGPAVAALAGACDASPVLLHHGGGGTIDGTEFRLTIDLDVVTSDDAYLLARVVDHALSTACPVDRFTRLVAVSGSGRLLVSCPPRAGKDALSGTVEPATGSPIGHTDLTTPAGVRPRRPTRSTAQARTVASGFAAVIRPPSVTSLAAILRHLLSLPVRVRPFALARVPVPPVGQVSLGSAGRRLGGRRPCWGLRVDIGPLDRRTFDRFGPGTRASRRVGQLLATLVGPGCPVVVRPVLRATEVPVWRLGDGRLGRSLWVGPRRTGSHFDELTVTVR